MNPPEQFLLVADFPGIKRFGTDWLVETGWWRCTGGACLDQMNLVAAFGPLA